MVAAELHGRSLRPAVGIKVEDEGLLLTVRTKLIGHASDDHERCLDPMQ